jgi:hypothetical protein
MTIAPGRSPNLRPARLPTNSGVLRSYLLDRHPGPPVHAVGPIHAYDGHGAYLRAFPSPQAAHQWAHQHAAQPGTVLPVEVDDRAAGWTHQVWPEHCQLLLWLPPIPLDVSGHRPSRLTLVAVGSPA